MEYRYRPNYLLCFVKQSSIFNYVYANVNYILTACKAALSILIMWIYGAVLSCILFLLLRSF